MTATDTLNEYWRDVLDGNESVEEDNELKKATNVMLILLQLQQLQTY